MPQRHLIQRHRVTPVSNIRDHETTQRRPGYIPLHHAARTPAQSAAVSVGILLYGPTKLGPRRLGRPNVRASKTLTVVYKNTVLPRLTFWDKVTYWVFRLNVPQRIREWYIFETVSHMCLDFWNFIHFLFTNSVTQPDRKSRVVQGSVSGGQSCGEVPLVASATVVVSSIVRHSQRNQRDRGATDTTEATDTTATDTTGMDSETTNIRNDQKTDIWTGLLGEIHVMLLLCLQHQKNWFALKMQDFVHLTFRQFCGRYSEKPEGRSLFSCFDMFCNILTTVESCSKTSRAPSLCEVEVREVALVAWRLNELQRPFPKLFMVFWSSEAPREIHVEEMGYLTEMKTSWNVPETTTLKSFKFLYPPQVFSYPETESARSIRRP